ncbi:MAG TPA: hypothetical protein VMB02_11790, partial [Candidatus Aquilonibacter sp.]|nr:hypothetical protein [Candidatus Aquilonibacter sp.]
MPDTIVLRIVAAQRSDNRKIFDKRITLPIDDETRSLLETHGPESGVSTATAAVSWVRPGYRVQDGANAPR